MRNFTALRERYALLVHGVGLSIGSMQPLDHARIRAPENTTPDRYEPESFSERLSHGRRTTASSLTTCCHCLTRRRR